ncbi:helix-turn-helix transcriptional regulator [Hamadaea sp. NPDC050747]|uniref:helix-turn-helix domain-containing protein n=1 Tax=Hamadaea sp. NPDC050747 TaxID=3155789 RepID=UPI0033F4278F
MIPSERWEGSVARQENPVDPLAGPLQSFAYDLRKVRIEAGNPTYRALARTAGYSPTTLSEAAAGLRKPSLDVVLAYVGACGGDVEAWRRRWEQLDRDLAEPGTDPEADSGAVAGAEPPAPARRRWPLVAGVAVTVIVAVAAVVFVLREPAPKAEANGCPALPPHRTFTAVTYGKGAPVRAAATLTDPVLMTVPSGCTLGFTGFCVGQRVRDATGGTPDVRWFVLPDGKVVPSAVVHGNPPAALTPVPCAKGRPSPDGIALVLATDTAKPGGLKATVSGHNLEIVGFAVRRSTGAWRPLGLTEKFTATLTVNPGEQIVVAAAACFGGDGPTGLIDARRFPGAAQSATLSTAEYAAASQAACAYP